MDMWSKYYLWSALLVVAVILVAATFRNNKKFMDRALWFCVGGIAVILAKTLFGGMFLS